MRATVLCLASMCHQGAMSQDLPVTSYRLQTTSAIALCRVTVATALARMAQGDSATEAQNNGNGTDGDGNWSRCIADGRDKAMALYQAAAKVTKKTAARDALKGYHAIFTSSLVGVIPAAQEMKLDYNRRQQLADTRLTEAWTRYELEL